jgi:hypothetical protein
VENSVEKVENTVGNPTSFSQNRWKTQWKKLKNHSRWDTLPITPQNGVPHFPRIFLNGPGKHDTMKNRKRPRTWAAKILFTEASAYELDLPP